MDGVPGRGGLARRSRALTQEASVRDISARDGVAPLLRRDEAPRFEDLAEVLERQRGARMESRRGHSASNRQSTAIGPERSWP